jgi:predicted RNA binding protein YcfA (HicA-like mRNA interferase family)
MKAISGKRVGRLLEQRGWTLARISGSHHIYTKTGSEVRITVPIHGNKSVKAGLQRHLMKLAGIAESDL